MLDKLPTELLQLCIDHVSRFTNSPPSMRSSERIQLYQKHDLANFSAASKWLREVAAPRLFESITLYAPDSRTSRYFDGEVSYISWSFSNLKPCLQHVKDVRVVFSCPGHRCKRCLDMTPTHVMSEYYLDEMGQRWVTRGLLTEQWVPNVEVQMTYFQTVELLVHLFLDLVPRGALRKFRFDVLRYHYRS